MATTTINGQTFETGAHVGDVHANIDDLNIAIGEFADKVLGVTTFIDEMAPHIAIIKGADGDYLEAVEALEAISDDAVNALREATADGFYWDVEDNHLVLLVEEG